MNVVVLTGLYPPAGGGAEQVMAMLARGLVSLGHKVTVITVHGQVTIDPAERIGVLTVPDHRAYPYTELPRHGFWSRFRWHLADLLDGDQARRVVLLAQQEKADLVITGNIKGLGGTLPREIRRAGLRHVHVVHDVQPVEPSGLLPVDEQTETVFKTTLVRWVWMVLMRRLWRSPEVVVFPSAWLQSLCVSQKLFSHSKRVIIRNPVASGLQVKEKSPAGLPSSSLHLLFVGHLEPHKGITELVAAIRALPDSDIRLDVVGDGSLRLELERRAHDPRIHFHGKLFGEALSVRYAEADALIAVSRVAENAPLVVVEALRRHVPVIATPVGGVPELVIPGQTGWLAWPGSPAFSDALQALRQSRTTPVLHWQGVPEIPDPVTYASAVLKELISDQT